MPPTLPIKSVNHLARITRNLDASRRFYRDVLGFREIARPDFGFPGAWLYNYGLQIHLIVNDAQARDRPSEISTRATHLALHVDDVPAVEGLLEQHGIEYRKNSVPKTGITQLFFLDPDGYHIELATYPPAPPFLEN